MRNHVCRSRVTGLRATIFKDPTGVRILYDAGQSVTGAFMTLVKGHPVHLVLSGRTMEFDGDAKCVAGC